MRLYVNPIQQRFLRAGQGIKVMVAGRGSGKSTVIGLRTRQVMAEMPRAKTFFSSTTYAQILTKTLPAIESMWQGLGLKEWVSPYDPGHYVVGRRPPAGFEKPYSPPKKYQNIITFFNGYTIEFLSMDRPDLARGGSYDGGDIDEAALVKQEAFNRVILPSVRGNRHRFNSPLLHQVGLYTSMPWNTSGNYILGYEDLAKQQPDKYFYCEGTAEDNIHVLGREYIERLRSSMSPLEFAVEVMNQRITKVEDQFYHQFDEDRHQYMPKYVYDEGERGISLTGINDHNPDQLIEVSMDFSGWFNGMICFQERKNEERAFDSFFVKRERKIDDLIDDFCESYRTRQVFKYVRIWGEPRGHDQQPNSPTLYQQIQSRFQKNGWGCEVKAKAIRTTGHIQRHYFMNELLSEKNQQLPRLRINREQCKDVIISIQLTQVKPDFTKNKTKEKDREYPQEHAPHFTDMLDYYLYDKHVSKSRANGMSGMGIPGSVVFG